MIKKINSMLMKNSSTGLIIFLLLFLCCSSCQKQQQQEVYLEYLDLEVVHDPLVKPLLNTLNEQFYATSPKLADGRLVKIKLISENAVSAAQKIADGRLKTVLWLAQSKSLVNWTNSTLSNLGPQQIDCKQLFSTPVVIATQTKNKELLNAHQQQIAWNAFFISKFSEEMKEKVKANYIAYSHSNPDPSSTGLASLLQLAYLAAYDREQILDIDTLSSEHTEKKLREYESFVSSYSSSDSFLLNRTAKTGTNRMRFTLTTEQQVAAYNHAKAGGKAPLIALYPKEGSYWQSYNVCYSKADWVTPAHNAAAKKYVEFLASKSAQLAMKKAGFRPSIVQFENTPPLTDQFGINTTLPKNSFLSVPGNVITHLLKRWPELRRPAALAIIMDTSGSMEGTSLQTGKNHLRELLAKTTDQDLKMLISFASKAKVEVDATTDTSKVIAKLDVLKSIGGSSVYDGIKLGIDKLIDKELASYRKIMIVYTDGDDKNSMITRRRLENIISDRFSKYDINLIIVAIKKQEGYHDDLSQFANLANGVLKESDTYYMGMAFKELFKNL